MGLKTVTSSTTNLLSPGPGNYNINRQLGKVSYSFGLKTGSFIGKIKTPGPGTYEYDTKRYFNHIAQGRIGTSRRDDDMKRAQKIGSPGPGTYRYDATISHSALKQDAPIFGFGTADRNKMASVGQVVSPGPGAYKHRDVVGMEGLKRSMTARRPGSAPS